MSNGKDNRPPNVPARRQQQPAPQEQAVATRSSPSISREPRELVLREDIYLDANLFRSLFSNNETRANRFMAEAFAAIRRNPKLMEAERRSLIMALGEAAIFDLSVDPVVGDCYLVPVWSKDFGCNVVDFRIGYRGYIKLMHRGSQPIDHIYARVVRRGEHFEEHGGTDSRIEHRIPLESDIDATDTGIIGAYCSVLLRGSTRPIFRVLRRPQIIKAAEKSGSPKDRDWSTVWKEHFEEMAMKTAIRRVAKMVPGADDARAAMWREGEREAGRQPPILEQLRHVAGAPLVSTPQRQGGQTLDALVEAKQAEGRQPRETLPPSHPDAEPPPGWDDSPAEPTT